MQRTVWRRRLAPPPSRPLIRISLGVSRLMDNLNLIASRYVLDLLRPEEIVQLADRALTCGQYSAEAAELADLRTERHPSSAAVVPLFLAWLRGRGIELPNVADAAWKLLTHYIGRIVHGRVPPLEGL